MTVTLPYLSLRHIYKTNLVEENHRVLPSDGHSVHANFCPYDLVTLRLAADL